MLSLTSPVETPYHRVPAGVKLALLAGVSVGVFQLREPVWLGLFACGVAALYLFVSLPFARLGALRLWPLWPFIAVLTLWHAFTGDMALGLAICLRLTALVALANLLTMTTRMGELIDLVTRGLHPLRRFGVNPALVGFAIALVIRFIPVLLIRTKTLLQAWKARSPRKPNWRLLLPVFLTVLDDADHVAEALRARGGLSRENTRD